MSRNNPCGQVVARQPHAFNRGFGFKLDRLYQLFASEACWVHETKPRINTRLIDLSLRVETVKLLAVPTEQVPDAEFQKVLAEVRAEFAKHEAQRASIAANESLLRLLAKSEGPQH